MEYRRSEVLAVLRRTGLAEVADEVDSELPEILTQADLDRLAARFGVSRDVLVSRMGGSP